MYPWKQRKLGYTKFKCMQSEAHNEKKEGRRGGSTSRLRTQLKIRLTHDARVTKIHAETVRRNRILACILTISTHMLRKPWQRSLWLTIPPSGTSPSTRERPGKLEGHSYHAPIKCCMPQRSPRLMAKRLCSAKESHTKREQEIITPLRQATRTAVHVQATDTLQYAQVLQS